MKSLTFTNLVLTGPEHLLSMVTLSPPKCNPYLIGKLMRFRTSGMLLIRPRMVFVKCDVSSWEDQLNVFRVAKEKSPSGGIDIVIANAGIYGPDTLDGTKYLHKNQEPRRNADNDVRKVLTTMSLTNQLLSSST